MSANDFRAFLLSLGLSPGTVLPDGRWRRCPTESHPRKKNGAYKLAPDGRIGWGQDHASHTNAVTWRMDGHQEKPMPFDPAALARAHAEARRKQVMASHAAREFYANTCQPLRDGHPYLESHGLEMAGCSGLKLDRDGWLVVPAYRERNLMTVQRISPDGDKRFWPGAPVKGASYVVERRGASITVLCEGLATGLALFAAAPLTRILVAFNSGNLKQVAIPHAGMLAIAADNDWKTAERVGTNPGLLAAQEAAGAFGVGVVAVPPAEMDGSDWCDWRNEEIAKRTERRVYGSRETPLSIRRAVDAEVASAIMRAARIPHVKATARG